MNRAEDSHHDPRGDWAHVGRAAEDFARRVARDATRFAEKIQEHTSDFAHDMSREWRRARRHHRYHSFRPDVAPGDVRRVFEDVRGLVVDVLEGIDELITSVFPRPDYGADREVGRTWDKVVSNRDVACSACGQPVAVGDEAYVCRENDGVEYRCRQCGTATGADTGADTDTEP